ncbi:hypothetical protein QCA50_012758 [Cerrena zonata]|uniref:Phosphatidylinositol-specific phospholipase C X domain-containing protein n=1 Tax=Cerrena zonata TaxID=2478898 RepID=A0AAW0G153_9APHY
MVDYKTWMKELDDNTKLTQLAIPGTHNSAACHTALPSVQCQGESVTEQLKHGVRFFDIRVGKQFLKEGDDAKDLQVIHGKFPVKIPFPRLLKDVLKEFYDFIKDNKSETVLVSIKQEGTDDWNNDKDEFGNCIWDRYVDKQKDLWYLKSDLPKLGDARGKLVLFRRFGVKDDEKKQKFGFDAASWKYNTTEDDRGRFVVQDFCEIQNKDDISKKVKYVKDLAEKAQKSNDDKLFVNFTSGSNFFDHDCWPQQVADAMDKGGVEKVFAKGCGIIVLDYIEAHNWKLAKALIDKNF